MSRKAKIKSRRSYKEAAAHYLSLVCCHLISVRQAVRRFILTCQKYSIQHRNHFGKTFLKLFSVFFFLKIIWQFIPMKICDNVCVCVCIYIYIYIYIYMCVCVCVCLCVSSIELLTDNPLSNICQLLEANTSNRRPCLEPIFRNKSANLPTDTEMNL